MIYTLHVIKCGDMTCKRTCQSEELHCLILDDNGYIVVSDYPQETGFFFGEKRGDIMKQLVEEGIYKITTMYDYQALCTVYSESTNPASRLFSVSYQIWLKVPHQKLESYFLRSNYNFQPTVHMTKLIKWAIGTFLYYAKFVFGDIFESITDSEHYPDLYNRERSDNGESDIRSISEISDTELIMK